jgi:hypothetical protein
VHEKRHRDLNHGSECTFSVEPTLTLLFPDNETLDAAIAACSKARDGQSEVIRFFQPFYSISRLR